MTTCISVVMMVILNEMTPTVMMVFLRRFVVLSPDRIYLGFVVVGFASPTVVIVVFLTGAFVLVHHCQVCQTQARCPLVLLEHAATAAAAQSGRTHHRCRHCRRWMMMSVFFENDIEGAGTMKVPQFTSRPSIGSFGGRQCLGMTAMKASLQWHPGGRLLASRS